ncbi:hypothetical protein HAZT_HAZT003248 [Hyalella azteca]|uniref:TraB domain-containing protein n=1 Tax=Hyalella azteca TaxID=294128 RepID=A0A6A0H877_HYAAZ|nr:hypothetical protein HAZT_HAZT003248 [Hyalella azteca]
MVVTGSMTFALTPSAAAALHVEASEIAEKNVNRSKSPLPNNATIDTSKCISISEDYVSSSSEEPRMEGQQAALETKDSNEVKVSSPDTNDVAVNAQEEDGAAKTLTTPASHATNVLHSSGSQEELFTILIKFISTALGDLPSTVVRLVGPNNCEVFVVGTAHFSEESQQDVVATIEKVRPDVVVLELCRARTAILSLDEQTILQESTNMDFTKMRAVLSQHGRVQGILYLLLLSVSAHITKQLGMAPGGEFRVAVSAVKRLVPGASIQLGDRPINITLGRALAALSPWSKLKLAFHIITTSEPIRSWLNDVCHVFQISLHRASLTASCRCRGALACTAWRAIAATVSQRPASECGSPAQSSP